MDKCVRSIHPSRGNCFHSDFSQGEDVNMLGRLGVDIEKRFKRQTVRRDSKCLSCSNAGTLLCLSKLNTQNKNTTGIDKKNMKLDPILWGSHISIVLDLRAVPPSWHSVWPATCPADFRIRQLSFSPDRVRFVLLFCVETFLYVSQ